MRETFQSQSQIKSHASHCEISYIASMHIVVLKLLLSSSHLTVILSFTVRILKSSRIHESFISIYNVRKTVNPILFRLTPL